MHLGTTSISQTSTFQLINFSTVILIQLINAWAPSKKIPAQIIYFTISLCERQAQPGAIVCDKGRMPIHETALC